MISLMLNCWIQHETHHKNILTFIFFYCSIFSYVNLKLNCLQAQISQLEHSYAQHLLEVTARHHQELDLETDRLRDSQLQAEVALETRERAHHQRVKCLEEQVLQF